MTNKIAFFADFSQKSLSEVVLPRCLCQGYKFVYFSVFVFLLKRSCQKSFDHSVFPGYKCQYKEMQILFMESRLVSQNCRSCEQTNGRQKCPKCKQIKSLWRLPLQVSSSATGFTLIPAVQTGGVIFKKRCFFSYRELSQGHCFDSVSDGLGRGSRRATSSAIWPFEVEIPVRAIFPLYL